MIKQLSVFIENKPGRMADVTAALADAGVNLHALSIADSTDFGIVRIIVSRPEYAKDILKEAGFTVKTTDVLAVALEHKPGSLSFVLRELEKANISIDYMYAFSRLKGYEAIVVFSPQDPQGAVAKIESLDINSLNAEAVADLDK